MAKIQKPTGKFSKAKLFFWKIAFTITLIPIWSKIKLKNAITDKGR
ncbi:hypothetical protein NB625_01335 [Mesomycoplasma hyopneumoniae]